MAKCMGRNSNICNICFYSIFFYSSSHPTGVYFTTIV